MSITLLLKIALVFLNILAVVYLYRFFVLKADAKKNTRVINLKIFTILFFLILQYCVYLDARYLEPNWIQITNLKVTSHTVKARVVHLTDLHIERIGFRERRLVSLVNTLKPDLILLGGDFVNTKEGIAACHTILSQMHSRYGQVAILGNIDEWFFKPEILEMLGALEIPVLIHDSLKYDFGGKDVLWISGLSYGNENKGAFKQALLMVPIGEPKVLLSHKPEAINIPELNKNNIILVLAGHTHGGQLGIPWLRKFSSYVERSRYMSGLFKVNNVDLYVNRGIGVKNKHLRFLCRPEITVIDFSPAN